MAEEILTLQDVNLLIFNDLIVEGIQKYASINLANAFLKSGLNGH